MDSFLRYSTTFLDTPAVSRKTCGSKEPLLPLLLGFFAFIVASKLRLAAGIPPHNHPTKKVFSKLYKIAQRAPGQPLKCATERRERAMLANRLGGPNG